MSCPLPVFFFSSQMAWANPSPRLHKARLQMNDVTNAPPSRTSRLLWERICLTQKWYWPMKPFRRVRPGRVLPASPIDQDTGRQVEKALERQPLMSVRLLGSRPILRVDLPCKRGFPITFNHDRVLKLWRLVCLCHCHFFTPRSLKNWGRASIEMWGCLEIPALNIEGILVAIKGYSILMPSSNLYSQITLGVENYPEKCA